MAGSRWNWMAAGPPWSASISSKAPGCWKAWCEAGARRISRRYCRESAPSVPFPTHSLLSRPPRLAFEVQVSPQTDLLRDLLYRGETIQSHALHLFCLAAPDYLDYPSAIALAADHPDAVRLGLRLKKLGNSMQEVIGGRAVHPVNAVLGGFGKLPSEDQLIALRAGLLQAVGDCQTTVDLIASLPAADFCRSDTVFAALRSPGDYGYYLGDEVVVLSNGTTGDHSGCRLPVADQRAGDPAFPRQAQHVQWQAVHGGRPGPGHV